ncbi:hypothetical protein [Micromonospora rubida]
MPVPRYLIVGTVPPGSPAGALTGRTITLPADTPADVARRVTEACRAGIGPRMTWAARP